MKSTLTPTRWTMRASKCAFRTFTMLSTLALCIGCVSQNLPDGKLPGTVSSADEVYVALSGGGWRAHTAHAAWTIGLLDNQTTGPQQTLDQVFTNVSAVSSNSGGSWFNIMLSYSKDFRALIEGKNASNTYVTDTGGYFRQEKTLIQSLPEPTECDVWEHWSQLYFMCIVGEGVNAPLNWDAIVHGVVFEPFSMSTNLAGTTLSGQRQSWADGKSLLLAATMLTTEAVLADSEYVGDKYYYDALKNDLLNLGPLNVAPVTFSSVPQGAKVPTFFPSVTQPFTLAYNYQNATAPRPLAKNNHANLNSDGINVVTAAAASSAAAGFVASHAIDENNGDFLADVPLTDWEIAYRADRLPVYFNLPAPPGTNVARSGNPPKPDSKYNADGRYVQIADGGALDNSGVIQMVRYHQQQHDKSTPFTIVAFDNVQDTYTPSHGKLTFSPVGIDIAYLFGAGFTDLGKGTERFCTGGSATSNGFCITVVDQNATPPVSPQVFDIAGIHVDAEWTYEIEGKGQLVYTRYMVTTVDSALMGVAGGWTGTLHAFTCQWPDADTAPWTTSSGGKLGDEDWAAYAAMFDAIQTGLKKHAGLEHLRAALGLPTP